MPTLTLTPAAAPPSMGLERFWTQVEAANAVASADFASRAHAALAEIPALRSFVRTAGYAAPGDGGHALYKRVSIEPEHDLWFEDAVGGLWEIAEAVLSAPMAGCFCDGTDRTEEARSLVRAGERLGRDCYFPDTGDKYVLAMITLAEGGIGIYGDHGHTHIEQTIDETCEQVEGMDYTVSSVFFIRPTAEPVSIDWFYFTQDNSFNGIDSAYTSVSPFSPITGYRADRLRVDNCVFACHMGRGLQLRGGNYCHVGFKTWFLGCGMTASVGFTNDAYYGDPGVSVSSPFYSPVGLFVGGKFAGAPTNSKAGPPLHLTGCQDFTAANVHIVNWSMAAYDGLRCYSSDFGCSDINGNVVAYMKGTIIGLQVQGTVLHGLSILCDSALGPSTDVSAEIEVTSCNLQVTGIGVFTERFINGQMSHIKVRSSASPFRFADEMWNSRITHMDLTCTSAGTSDRTITANSTADLTGIKWEHWTVTTAAGDDYGVDMSGVAQSIKDGFFRHITWILRSTGLTRAAGLGTLAGSVDVSGHRFDIQHSGSSGVILMSAEGTADIAANDNYAFSSTGVSIAPRGLFFITTGDLSADGNDCGACRFDVDGVLALGPRNRFVSGISGVVPLVLRGATTAVMAITGLYVEVLTAAGNVAAITVTQALRSKLFGATVKTAASSAVPVQALSSGVLRVAANDIINATSGVAPYSASGTAKIAGDLGDEQNASGAGTTWTVANIVPANQTKPGTRAWVSDGDAGADCLAVSDGSNWQRVALGATIAAA